MTREKFQGAILGLALGDALGAAFEGGPIERLVWRVIGSTGDGRMRWTDDTQMTIDLIQSMVASGGIDQDDLARRFAASYRWSRGYGPGAARILKRIARGWDWRKASTSVFRDGSFGNGGAMRVPAVGLFYSGKPISMVAEAARRSAEVTHGHPLAQEGAVLIAVATAAAVNSADGAEIVDAVSECSVGPAFTERWSLAREWLDAAKDPEPRIVARHLGNGISAVASCVTAIYLAVRHLDRPFADMVDAAIAGKGDTDTIAAMAGAIWGAARGMDDLPGDSLEKLEQREFLESLGKTLYEHRLGDQT